MKSLVETEFWKKVRPNGWIDEPVSARSRTQKRDGTWCRRKVITKFMSKEFLKKVLSFTHPCCNCGEEMHPFRVGWGDEVEINVTCPVVPGKKCSSSAIAKIECRKIEADLAGNPYPTDPKQMELLV